MKNPFIKAKINIQEKMVKTAVGFAEKALKKKLEGKTFDQMAAAARRTIPMAGVDTVRQQLLSGMEDEVKDNVAKGMTDEEILKPCKESLNFRVLLNELDLNFDHIEVIIKNARDEAKELKI